MPELGSEARQIYRIREGRNLGLTSWSALATASPNALDELRSVFLVRYKYKDMDLV